jgi:hypothetical protein
MRVTLSSVKSVDKSMAVVSFRFVAIVDCGHCYDDGRKSSPHSAARVGIRGWVSVTPTPENPSILTVT